MDKQVWYLREIRTLISTIAIIMWSCLYFWDEEQYIFFLVVEDAIYASIIDMNITRINQPCLENGEV